MRRQRRANVDDRATREEGSAPLDTNPEAEDGRSDQPEPTQSESSTQPLPTSDGALDEDRQELLRQREELALLHSELDTRGRRQRRITLLRKIVAAVLVAIAALGVTLSVIGVWAGRTTLDTDRWVETVAPLSQDPAVQAAVSTYMTDQFFATLNVEQRVQEALPPRSAFLAIPLTCFPSSTTFLALSNSRPQPSSARRSTCRRSPTARYQRDSRQRSKARSE